MYHDDLTLFLLNDADTPAAWMAYWAAGYPLVRGVSCAAADAGVWQNLLQQTLADTEGGIMPVAYGTGAAALAQWYARADWRTQKRVRAVMLVSPQREQWARHIVRLPRFQCRTAWVVGADSPDNGETAAACGARLLRAPQRGSLNGNMGGWEWGMRLMQEMSD